MTSGKRLTAIASAAMLLLAAGCGDGKPALENTGPDDKGNPGLSRKVSVAYLKSLYANAPVVIDEDIKIEGRIVSSDKQGNFYQTLCIEDQTGGIAVRMADEEIFRSYRYGHEVSISCNSLLLGTYGGLLQLGDGSGEVEPIPQTRIGFVVSLLETTPEEPVPATLTLKTLSERHLNCYVRVEDVQFIDEETGLPWCDTDMTTGKYVDTNRNLTNLRGDTLIVRTSRHARFAAYRLPEGRGSISGILSYFNRKYQLILSDPQEADMEEPRQQYNDAMP